MGPSSESLHLLIAQAIGINHDSQAIALQGHGAKHVTLNEPARFHDAVLFADRPTDQTTPIATLTETSHTQRFL
jgi:hypothetical protein